MPVAGPNAGCGGGYVGTALECVIDKKGIDYELPYPHQGVVCILSILDSILNTRALKGCFICQKIHFSHQNRGGMCWTGWWIEIWTKFCYLGDMLCLGGEQRMLLELEYDQLGESLMTF